MSEDNVIPFQSNQKAGPGGGGGDGVNARLRAVEERLVSVDKRLVRLETRMENMATKEDIEKLKNWVLIGALSGFVAAIPIVLLLIKVFFL